MKLAAWIFGGILLCGFGTASGQVLTQGPNGPGTAVDDASIGTEAWSNPSYATADDSNRAFALVSSGSQTHYLKATGFGFSVPAGAVIDGIEVRIKKQSAGGEAHDNAVRIVKNDTIGSTDRSDSAAWPAGTDTTVTYGGSSDLWGETWSAGDINSSNFGVAVSAHDGAGGDVARVNYISATVYYSLCGDSQVSPGEQCDDGNTNDGDCCSSTCQYEPEGAPCTTDNNPCTDDECDATGTCEHNNNTDPCDDGSNLTCNDTCTNGACIGQQGGCLDHYQCYKAKDLKAPQFPGAGVILEDQFETKNTAAKKPFLMCNPTDKDGEGIRNSTDHLVCYKIKDAVNQPAFVPTTIEATDQFGSVKLELKKAFVLCVPSTKTVVQ